MEDSKTISQNSTSDETQSSNSVDKQVSVTENKHKKRFRLIIMLVIIIIAVVLAFVWWEGYRKYITSDDANLDSYRIDVAPQVTGLISKLYVKEGDTVKKGDILFEIDTRAMISRLEESKAQYKQMLSQISVAEANLIDAENRLELARVAAGLVKKNYDRAKIQYKGDVITLEEFQTWEENQKSAQLKVEIAQTGIASSKAALNAAVLSADASKANVATMQTDMSYYIVRASDDGVIGKRWLLAGDIVNAGQNVFTLNKGKDIWVAVFLEETKFNNIYLGQEVKFSLDAYDKLSFYGKIYYIGDNAASEFALVPPSNASGNYTKVTQRIPIKISIDRVDGDKKQLDNYKLVSGMSANVKIIKD